MGEGEVVRKIQSLAWCFKSIFESLAFIRFTALSGH